MNIGKAILHNKMEEEFSSDYFLVYDEKRNAEKFSVDSIIDDFRDMQETLCVNRLLMCLSKR